MAAPNSPLPPPIPASTQIPDWLKFAFAAFIVGAIGEGLYKVNPNAGYLWVMLVLLGFAGTGGRTDAITKFFGTVGAIAKG